MVQSKAQISGYSAIDEDAWCILAGRVAAGSIVGASIADIPASHRFFAGGGGSVRGYRYRSLSPDSGFGFPTGGRSLFEALGEARIKVTQKIGIVPFVDVGQAFPRPIPTSARPCAPRPALACATTLASARSASTWRRRSILATARANSPSS